MGRLWVKMMECKYKDIDKGLKEQVINSINDLTGSRNSKKIDICKGHKWAGLILGQENWSSTVKEIYASQLKETKDFNMIRKAKPRESKDKTLARVK